MLKKTGYLLFLLLFVTFGCADSEEKRIVGTWQELNNPKGKLEFRNDHTGLAYWPDQSGKQESSEMTWKIFKGENRVSVITPPGPVDFDIKPDKLIAPNGVVLTKIR